MGKEADKVDELGAVVGGTVPEKIVGEEKGVAAEAKRAIGGINGPSPNKRSKKGKEGINFQIYDSYRKMLSPSSTWDRKARYSSIGKAVGQGYDDIFLVSSLNHHVSIVRVRVPDKLLSTLDGNEQEDWGRMNMWRSKWYDLFIAKERVDAMQVVWGMIAYLMRKVGDPSTEVDQKDTEGAKSKSEKMDLS